MADKESKKVYDIFQGLKTLQKISGGIDLQKAKALAFMKRDYNYQLIMGDPEATWYSFISQPELQPLKRSTADRLVKIYSIYIEQLGLKEKDIAGIDSNSLYRLSTIVDNSNIEDWLVKARHFSRLDLYREIKFGEVDEMACEHNWKIKKIKICKLCGVKEVSNT